MPKAVEDALRKAGRKKGYTGKRLENFVYGTMTNMAKKGEISWRGHMASKRKKALGFALVLLCLGATALADVQIADIEKWKTSNPNKGLFSDKLYGFSVYCQDVVPVAEDADGPSDPLNTSTDTVVRWVPWYTVGSDTTGFPALYCKVVVRKGDGINIRAFGPSLTGSADMMISLSPDSVSSAWVAPSEVDSLWLWDASGTGNVCIFAF